MKKKFIGVVNGKTYDNVEAFENAAHEAVFSNDGLLSITSYYQYTNEEEEDKKNYVNKYEYLVRQGEHSYNASPELLDKISKASNKDEIRKNVEACMESYERTYSRAENYLKNIEAIKKVVEDKMDGLNAYHDYYSKVKDALDKKEEPKKVDTNKNNNKKKSYNNNRNSALLDALNELNFFDK